MIYKITYRETLKEHREASDEKKYLYVLEDQIHCFIKERPHEDEPEVDAVVWDERTGGESRASTTTSYIEKIESV